MPAPIANDIATDRAVLLISSAIVWGLQPNTATNIYRAGLWPRMDGNRYSNQPNVGLAAGITSRATDADNP